MSESTRPGESETTAVTAGEAGEYALPYYIPGPTVTGLWIRFPV